MRKIFIDAGANDGCSVRKFRAKYDLNEEYEIYSFEVEPLFKDCFKDINNHIFINKAVWIIDGELEFYRDSASLHCGGTVIKSKVTGNLDKKHPITVKTIDFSSWIKVNFSKTDQIILKMDIEGAEYEVLRKMLDDRTIDYINELWIEWHPKKIKLPMEQHDKLVSQININMQKWDALKW